VEVSVESIGSERDVQPIWITVRAARDGIEPLAGPRRDHLIDQEQRIPRGFHHRLVIADRGVSARVLVSGMN
jgi:hypothetical protein